MSFDPQRSYRATDAEGDELYFFELFLAPGPERIGETGDNSYQAMFGHNWLVLIERETRILRAYQERGGVWAEVVEDLPPVFGTVLPAGVRRLSFAFDQAARMVVAYEKGDGTVTGTRWEPEQQSYIQNINFVGINPCLLMQATADFRVPGSDIWVFYQRTDAPGSIFYRIQNELYHTEHAYFTDASIGILDRAQALTYRHELLVADAQGTPLQGLISDLAPLGGETSMRAGATGPFAGTYRLVVLTAPPGTDPLGAAASGPRSGVYLMPIVSYQAPAEPMTAASSAPKGGLLRLVVVTADGGREAMAAAVTSPQAGSYVDVVTGIDVGANSISVGASAPKGGTYAAV